MIADIASGNTGVADVFFLVAIILCVLVVVAYLIEAPPPAAKIVPAMSWAAVGCIAFGLLQL